MNEKLKNEFDAMFGGRFSQLTGNNKYIELRDKIINWKIDSIPIEPPVSDDFGEQEYEPYFGWCDVDGCENEGCSGGNAWRESGYWTVCSKHADDCRAGKPQPKMKQKSIDRENSRDKTTGYLPSVSQNSR